MKFEYRPRTGAELAALDPVALAAQADVLQLLVVALAGSVYGDPVASIGGMLDDLAMQPEGSDHDAEAVDLRARYVAGFEAAKRHIVDVLDSAAG